MNGNICYGHGNGGVKQSGGEIVPMAMLKDGRKLLNGHGGCDV